MLAVFSLPEGAGALNLRRERYALARLVQRIAKVNDKAIELRVLQYGATRERLRGRRWKRPGLGRGAPVRARPGGRAGAGGHRPAATT